ncbi:uncharacterized protein LOC119671422 isoform X2 [Teleopsis dalmanni]|uniref:uncharacterized protein LOC119671422 isoform X2 n=1 Tax=Teleopsis dalmanni TaxID=139649 RepID=UPI0018CEBA26|nr:uncharacterized protein LOC119671422 isoform X2 [Teleopsis dalmanni]
MVKQTLQQIYECKRKWEALRVSYTKELRLQKGLERRGKMKAVRTGWYLTKEMSFLENCITRQKTKSDWSSSLEEYTGGDTTNSDTFDKIKEKTRISDITRPVRSESIPCTENTTKSDTSVKIKKKTRISDITRPVRSESIPCTENTTNSDTFDKIKEKTRISDITRPVRSESIPCTENISTADNTPTIENTPPLLVYINENRYNKKEIEEAEMAFFKGLLPQIQQLSRERKRRFERDLLLKLHELLAEEEQELLNNFL